MTSEPLCAAGAVRWGEVKHANPASTPCWTLLASLSIGQRPGRGVGVWCGGGGAAELKCVCGGGSFFSHGGRRWWWWWGGGGGGGHVRCLLLLLVQCAGFVFLVKPLGRVVWPEMAAWVCVCVCVCVCARAWRACARAPSDDQPQFSSEWNLSTLEGP